MSQNEKKNNLLWRKYLFCNFVNDPTSETSQIIWKLFFKEDGDEELEEKPIEE